MITDEQLQRYAQVFVNGDLVTADKAHLAAMNIKVIIEDSIESLLAEIEQLKAQNAALSSCQEAFEAIEAMASEE